LHVRRRRNGITALDHRKTGLTVRDRAAETRY
jgi:hypothetical protein